MRFTPGARRRIGILASIAMIGLLASGCGSRLDAAQFKVAVGSNSGNGQAVSALGATTTTTPTSFANTTTTTGGSGPTGSTGPTTPGLSDSATTVPGATTKGATVYNSSNNGGATDVGVTATTINVANIASITGVAPGLTQSAQQATEAFAAYVNSQGGIYGRMLKVQPYDDQNDASQNYADATQACSNDFAMLGNASGFDDGGAQAVASCGIPTMAAEVSTEQAGDTADIFGDSPGNAHYWPLGGAEYLKAKYPNAITKAAFLYLNIPTTENQATHEMAAYSSVGFNYIYTASVSATEANYAPYVLAMQQKGVQYVSEYSDLGSAARLVEAMEQQNFAPQVVDWFSEMYSPSFVDQTSPATNGNLVLMATAPYEEASSNPEMQLYLSWLNRVAPGAKHDIFGIFAWSAGLAFLKAALAVGPHLTRAALITQLQQITSWTGDGLQPVDNIGGKIPSACFSYFVIQGENYVRDYPSATGSYDCSGGLFHYSS